MLHTNELLSVTPTQLHNPEVFPRSTEFGLNAALLNLFNSQII